MTANPPVPTDLTAWWGAVPEVRPHGPDPTWFGVIVAAAVAVDETVGPGQPQPVLWVAALAATGAPCAVDDHVCGDRLRAALLAAAPLLPRAGPDPEPDCGVLCPGVRIGVLRSTGDGFAVVASADLLAFVGQLDSTTEVALACPVCHPGGAGAWANDGAIRPVGDAWALEVRRDAPVDARNPWFRCPAGAVSGDPQVVVQVRAARTGTFAVVGRAPLLTCSRLLSDEDDPGPGRRAIAVGIGFVLALWLGMVLVVRRAR